MRRRFVRPLSAQEREEVTRLNRASTSAELVRRCHAVLLSAEGQPIPTIAHLLRVDQSVIHRWLDRFEAGGVAALAPQERAGRPPRWYGLEHSVWTCALLAGYLAQQTGITLSAERARVLLHQHGIRLKQPTPVVHSPDPLYDPKGYGWR
jgi:transposase